MKRIAIVAIALAVTGCASREEMTSGEIGCPPNEIVITDGKMGLATNTWTATCRGKTFYCRNSDHYGFTCAPEL